MVTKARPEDTLGFLPVRAGKHDMTAIVDNRTGELVSAAAARPWEY